MSRKPNPIGIILFAAFAVLVVTVVVLLNKAAGLMWPSA